MPIQKRGTGRDRRFIARYYGPDGKQRSKSFDREGKAKDWLAARELEVRRGDWIDPEAGATRLEAVVLRWRDLATRAGTRRVRQHLLDNLGELRDYPVSAVQTPEIRKWLTVLAQGRPWAKSEPLADRTRTNLYGQLIGALALAQEDGLIRVVPSVKGATGSRIAPVKRSDIFTTEQVLDLVTAAREGGWTYLEGGGRTRRRPAPTFARMILTGAGAGPRPGEVCGLRPRSVDFLRRELAIVEQGGPGAGWSWGPLKTDASDRRVPLADPVVQVLAEELAENPAERDAPLFRTARGGQWTPTTIANMFVRLRRDVGLDSGGFHTLRHYFASSMIDAGVSVAAVAEYMGHANPSVTLEVYTHLWPGSDDRVREAVAGALSAPVRDQQGMSGMVSGTEA